MSTLKGVLGTKWDDARGGVACPAPAAFGVLLKEDLLTGSATELLGLTC